VVFTRARGRLHITPPGNPLIFGQTQSMPVSRFICDIPPQYVEEFGGSRHEGRAGYGESAGASGSAAAGPAGAQGIPGAGGGRPATREFAGLDSFLRKPGAANGNGQPASGPQGSQGDRAGGGQSGLPGSGTRPGSAGFPGTRPSGFGAPASGASAGLTASPAAGGKAGLDPNLVRKGDKVKHARFGIGMVQSVDPVAGDAILTIRFDAAGIKRMLARQAPLELV